MPAMYASFLESQKSSFETSLEQNGDMSYLLAALSQAAHTNNQGKGTWPRTLNLGQWRVTLPVKFLIENQAVKMYGPTPNTLCVWK